MPPTSAESDASASLSFRPPAIVTLDSELVAVGIVRTVVGRLGILSAVPLTPAFATWLADCRDHRESIEPEMAGARFATYRD